MSKYKFPITTWLTSIRFYINSALKSDSVWCVIGKNNGRHFKCAHVCDGVMVLVDDTYCLDSRIDELMRELVLLSHVRYSREVKE